MTTEKESQMTAAKTTDRQTLEKARDLLEAAHARIENVGFNIASYNGTSNGAPACYIGTVRMAAGLDGFPDTGCAGDGDGPELPVALTTLDSVVADLLDQRRAKAVKWDWEDRLVGRMVEAYGFQLRDACMDGLEENEKDEALRVVRLALTEIRNQLEMLA